MKKMGIDWHKNCLKNVESSLGRMENELQRAKDSYQKLLDDYKFYKYQIAMAESQGKDGFDRDKFKVKKYKGGLI